MKIGDICKTFEDFSNDILPLSGQGQLRSVMKRFTTRSLLLAMALVCAWMSVLSNRATIEREALAVVGQYSGGVCFDWHVGQRARGKKVNHRFGFQAPNDPEAQKWAESMLGKRPLSVGRRCFGWMLGEEYFQRTVSVAIPKCGWEQIGPQKISASELSRLAKLKSLRHIRLHVQELDKEHFLAMSRSDSIESIAILRAEIKGNSIRELARMRQLKELTLIDCKHSSASLDHLREEIPSCKISSANYSVDITPL